MEKMLLNAQLRESIGARGKLSKIRNEGMIPSIVYGIDKPSTAVSVSEKEILSVLKKGTNNIITIKYGENTDSVIFKKIQRHVVTGKIIHIDFYRISLTKKIEVKVPINFIGEAYGVKTQGGIIEHDMRELTLTCLPLDIPHEITVDVSNLKIGDSLRVKDIKLEKAEIKEESERIIASVMTAKEEVVEKAPTAEEAKAEPEVIAKGKKEEEGEATKTAGATTNKEDKKAEPKK